MANDTTYGLGSAVFTNDLTKAHRVARNIEAGMVWVNSSNDSDFRIPFGVSLPSFEHGRTESADDMRRASSRAGSVESWARPGWRHIPMQKRSISIWEPNCNCGEVLLDSIARGGRWDCLPLKRVRACTKTGIPSTSLKYPSFHQRFVPLNTWLLMVSLMPEGVEALHHSLYRPYE